jgi:hypothetical protein
MLPRARAGSSGDRTRLDRTSCPGPSMMMPNGFARWRIPGRNWVTARAASRRVLARTGASRTQWGNDVRTTSPRLRGELRLTLDTLSHYSPVFIAPLAINSLRRRVQFYDGCQNDWDAPNQPKPRHDGSLHWILRLLSDAVATSREDHRSPRSGPEVQHRRWDRERRRR